MFTGLRISCNHPPIPFMLLPGNSSNPWWRPAGLPQGSLRP